MINATTQERRLGREEMLKAARAFIESGYHLTLLYGTTAEGVCECRLGPRCKSPGKHPQERGWTTRPIRTAADLVARWERTGGTPNIGVMPDDGLVVIDVDRKNGKRGAESLAALEAELGPLGEPHQTTVSTGLHYVFRVPPETDAASLPNRTDVAEGIDILISDRHAPLRRLPASAGSPAGIASGLGRESPGARRRRNGQTGAY